LGPAELHSARYVAGLPRLSISTWLIGSSLVDVFSSSDDFDAWFKGKGESDEQQQQVVSQLHKVLRPFLLRRVKAEVEHSLLPKKEVNLYVGMSDMQKKWYKSLLEKDIDAVNGKSIPSPIVFSSVTLA